MEPQYHQFGPPDNNSVHDEQRVSLQTGMKRIVVYILYGVLLLLLLILLLVTGVKFSQLNNDITDVRLHLMKIGGQLTSLKPVPAEQDVLVQRIKPVRETCGEGWVSFQKSCYLLSRTTSTWSKAEQLCQSHNGHLLVLNNMEELDYISKIVETHYNYWIGLVERQDEGQWTWVDGTDFNTTPVIWDDGQPDDWDYQENGEDCGQIHSSEKRIRKKLNDSDCKISYRYICEIRA